MIARLQHPNPWPALRSVLTDSAWAYMKCHAAEVTPAVMAWADARARGAELRPIHIALAIRQQRRLRGRAIPLIRR